MNRTRFSIAADCGIILRGSRWGNRGIQRNPKQLILDEEWT